MVDKPHAFELTLTHRKLDNTLISYNRIYGNDFIELLSQFNLVIALVMREDHEAIVRELKYGRDDEIPF